MTSKKLGALLRSVPHATVTETSAPADTMPASIMSESVPRPVALPAIAAEPEVPLQVLIPTSIRKQLALKAAEEGQSLRALVLRSIRSLGITVTDVDIKGKRGRRNV